MVPHLSTDADFSPGRLAFVRWGVGLRVALLTLLIGLIVKCAWVCDDAYITFRVIDNWVAGHGLRWNVAERVQAYTNPLWMMLVAAPYTVTREPFFTSLALSVALSSATAAWIAMRAASSVWHSVLALLLLCASKAFVDFSTSGLENPLLHLIAAVALTSYRGNASVEQRAFRLALGAALAATTRLDALALFAPALIELLWHDRSRAVLLRYAAGFAPLIAWELFSLVYYGFLLPNTAYAKLATNLPSSELAAQGVHYLANSLRLDPVTLPTIVAAILVLLARRDARCFAVALGLALQLGYIVRVGGDFMSGRFLSAAFVVAVVSLASTPVAPKWIGACASGALAAMIFAPFGPLRAPLAYQRESTELQRFDEHGIADERAATDDVGGLFAAFRERDERFLPHVVHGNALAEQARASGTKVKLAPNLGYFGFHAGPELYIVDPIGLADPLLARLPIWADGKLLLTDENNAERLPWRIGHFRRRLPDGYLRSLRDPAARIADPALAAFKDELDLITRGPLWSTARWRAIATHFTGRVAPTPTPTPTPTSR